ncbi:MAG: RluA family pseudouridine synthase [bacterium]|nr:RluA family pseudouridine synthase [bacterium]
MPNRSSLLPARPARLPRTSANLAQPVDRATFTVAADELPDRLDRYLARRLPWRSRVFFQTMIERGEVLVNAKPARPSRQLSPGDVIELHLARHQQAYVPPNPAALDILFEDDVLLVLNKPPGVVVHPTGVHLYDTLLNAVHARYPHASYLPRPVHRLDKETSGVLVLAKTDAARVHLGLQIEQRRVVKTYRALVHGVMAPREGNIDLPIGDSRYSHIRLKQDVVREGGLPAHSSYYVEASTPFTHDLLHGASLVTVRLITGRTHQIRVHLAAVGHPIIADKLYGRERQCVIADLQITGHLLHAWKFSCQHPTSRELLTFVAPLPPTFAACVQALFGPGIA